MTLLFGLTTLLTKAQDTYSLPKAAHGPLGVALVLLAAAGVGGLVTNIPIWWAYLNADPAKFQKIYDRWDEPKATAEKRVAATRAEWYTAASAANELKARILAAAMALEVAAVVAVAVAVGEVIKAA